MGEEVNAKQRVTTLGRRHQQLERVHLALAPGLLRRKQLSIHRARLFASTLYSAVAAKPDISRGASVR